MLAAAGAMVANPFVPLYSTGLDFGDDDGKLLGEGLDAAASLLGFPTGV